MSKNAKVNEPLVNEPLVNEEEDLIKEANDLIQKLQLKGALDLTGNVNKAISKFCDGLEYLKGIK
jgi:uncharacterized protein YjgD (DUF1641 family)